MIYLVVIAILYGLYNLYQTINSVSINWRSYYTQDHRIDAVRKCVKNGVKYEESAYEKRMHERFGFKYDGWFEDYLNGKFDYVKAREWNYSHIGL